MLKYVPQATKMEPYISSVAIALRLCLQRQGTDSVDWLVGLAPG